MAKKRTLKTAWLVTWECLPDRTFPECHTENRNVAILNHRFSGEKVRWFVEQLYVARQFLSERLAIAKKASNNPERASFEYFEGIPSRDEIRCGTHPWLYARRVDNIYVETDEEGNEILRYEERLRPNR